MTSQSMGYTVVPLEGVDCEECAEKVRAALGRLEGVDQIDVQIKDARVRVSFQAEKLDPARIESRLRDIGFDAAPGQKRTVISVPGMC